DYYCQSFDLSVQVLF
nr:immunoglobulin light chain junction region [Macaca mulatta]MOW58420.1 immunoglobulin light chain junction region [Macaca mulatta]MOW59163.1 immunoglobulin light chain junction region [Macaca mulatta]MOW59210.1 immunoglobulin light chain junction region [Macaca mulatta]MOW60085.1 immunoglobulin light chain junction region [Macaca mulatta]